MASTDRPVAVMSDGNHAQYACDHCKHRKLKCSREIPKCANCRSWAGECVYSRHERIRRRPRSKIPESSANMLSGNTPLALQSSVLTVLTPPSDSSPFFSTPRSTPEAEDVRDISLSEKLLRDDSGQTFYLGPSPTASFLSQATSNVERVKDTFESFDLQSGAERGLSDLSDSFSAVGFEDASNIRANVKSFRRANEVFFIPRRDEGERLIDIFTYSIEKGKPFFFAPPLNLVRKLAFEPSQIDERGWLLLFNSIASTAVSLTSPLDERLARGLQWNIWTLLEDSTLFLEPSEVNIQALIMVAVHSQEISTPSFCWTLISHACRMSQTLALHLPVPSTPRDIITNSNRSFLFWTLFLIDKSLSLAFGRPSLLPSCLYKDIPPPNIERLAEFSPHIKATAVPGVTRNHPSGHGYGAVHATRSMALAKIQGDIQDAFYGNGRSMAAERISILKTELDNWFQVTREATQYHERETEDPDERKAVKLGIDFLTFQYHHLMVYLTRTDKLNPQTCVKSARSAINLLDSLVSSSIEVYNGVVWQLLYQPFMAYFVIFGNIISDLHSSDCFQDLQLLRRVVLYFLQMHNNHPSAKKLEKVAETFTRLAEAYVRHSIQNPRAKSQANTMPTHNPMTPSSQVQQQNDPSGVPTPPTSIEDSQMTFDFNDFNSDPIELLSFFATNHDTFPNANLNTQDVAAMDAVPTQPGEFSTLSANPLLRELENISQNCVLDGTFDWFSWDQYDSAMA